MGRNPSPGSHLSMRSDLSHKGRGDVGHFHSRDRWLAMTAPFAWLPSFGPPNPCASSPTAAHLSRGATMTAKDKMQGNSMAATRIDCDIHPAVGGTRTTLLPYLDDHWKEQVMSRAIDGLDLTSYPPNMPLSGRADWRPASGKPGSDLAMVQRGAFDQLGASHAICNVLYGAQAVFP